MFNYVLKRMYEEYSVSHSYDYFEEVNSIDFLKNEKIVATLYPKEQVINIFLSASPGIVCTSCHLAIFVIAKKYMVLNNGKIRKTEAAWLIGCCGATRGYNLKVPMYLGDGKIFEAEDVLPISSCYIGKKQNICFNLFDLQIEWKETVYPHFGYIPYLNPALVYPVKQGRKKAHNAKSYLREEYDWVYNDWVHSGCGAKIASDFIDKQANKVNHTEWSRISYHRVIKSN